MTTASGSTDELAPCPFCGEAGTVVHNNTSDYKQHWDWNVLCLKDGCGGTGPYADTREIAIERWNQRFSDATLTSQAFHIVRMREALETTTKTAHLLYENMVGCATNHHSVDFAEQGMPGWLRDCETSISAAQQALSLPLPESAERVRAMERTIDRVIKLERRYAEDVDAMLNMKERGDLTKDYGETNLRRSQRMLAEITESLTAYRGGGKDTE